MDNTTELRTEPSTILVIGTNFISAEEISELGIIIVTSFGIVMSLVSLYASIALLTHRINTIKARKEAKRKSQRPGRGSATNWMDNLSLLASILVLLSLTNDLVMFYSKDVSMFSCKLMQFLSKLLYAAGRFCVYLFFWFRQRSCYRNPSLAMIHNQFCRFVSAAILPVFLIINVTGVILSGFIWSFEKTENGCDEKNKSYIPLIGLFVISVVMQSTLLLLFLHPLKNHSNFLNERDMLSPADKVLTKLIKRSVVSTALCVFADVSAFTAAMSLNPQLPFIATNCIYDANLMSNVICMVGSFADWRCRVAPWCFHKYKIYRSGSYASTAYATSVKNISKSAAATQV